MRHRSCVLMCQPAWILVPRLELQQMKARDKHRTDQRVTRVKSILICNKPINELQR